MALAGDLATFDLADVFDWAIRRRKSGVLLLARRSTRKRLGLRDGQLRSAWSNDPRESLGQVLIRDRRITEEALFQALLRQEKEGWLLGEILIGDRVLTAEELRRCLEGRAEEVAYDLFLWPDGRFEFKDNEQDVDSPVDLDMPLSLVLEEGSYRREQWQQLQQRFPSQGVVVRAVPGAIAEDAAEAEILRLSSGGRSLAALSMELRRSAFETCLLVSHMVDRGAALVDLASGGSEEEADPVGAIHVQLARANKALVERHFDEARESFEKVLALDPLSQSAKKGLIAVSEQRRAARLREKVRLDGKPRLAVGAVALTQLNLDAEEGFLISRINGEWDVRSILKLCPMPEEEAILIFARLLERKLITIE